MPVGYTDIVGKFTRAVVDGPDSDRDPDRIPIEGLQFEFVVDLKPAIARDTVAKETVYLDPIPATTDANGVLIGPDGLPGIRLTASDSPDLEPNGWTYTVTTKGAGLPTVKTTFVTESGKTLDFSDIVAVPPNPGNQIPAWTAVVSQATTAAAEANEAKVEAVAAAESVQRDQPNGVAPLGADAKIPDAKLPARLADSALAAKSAQGIAGDAGYAGSPQQAVDERVAQVGGQAFVGRRDLEVSAAEFGVRGDGSDETVEMQAFLTWIASHGAHGVVPFREVRVSSSLVIPAERGWKLRGMGRFRGTNLIQTTPNVPILRVGVGGSGSLRDWTIEDICLTFVDRQPAASTGALCLKFESMPYQYSLRNVNFRNACWGVGYTAGVGGGWGGDWDGIVVSGISGGFYDMSGTINGVPNNRFGRIYIDADGATDYLFKQWRGYNTTVETIEVINYNGGLGLLDFTTQSVFIIGSFKLEGGSFTLPSVDLVRIPAGAFVRFGEFTLRDTNGGLVINPSAGDCSVFALGAGGTSVATLEIGVLNAQATSMLNGYLFRGGQRTTQVFIRRLERALWKIANTAGGTAMNENIVIDQWMNKRLSVNKGDAGLTVVPGETEGTLFFETPLTAQRDIILPSDTKDLIGGLQYRVYVAAGAVNGTNHLRLVIPGTRTVYSKTTSTAEVITVEWRRNTNGANGWVVTGVSPA